MKKGTAITFAAGILAGMALCGPAVQAASGVTAKPSSQPVFVDGQRASMTAYSISGSNYVKLRDIGEAVGFNVYWDGSAVQVEGGKPYTGVAPGGVQLTPTQPPAPSGEYTISADHWSREDFSRQANPAVFTGVYDRALYNTIRQTLVDGDAIDPPAYTMVAKGADYSAVVNIMGRLDNTKFFEHYVPDNFKNYWQYLDYFAVSSKVPPQFEAPLAYIQPVIAEVNRLDSDREKVTCLNDYLRTLLVYKAGEYAGIPRAFAPHDDELEANCGAYAAAFKFLCGAANIPCFTISTSDHTWNLVYVDSQWLHVDVAANDHFNRPYILMAESYPNHPDRAPEATAFIKELLVPGSTR